jgi:hypothetical protein
MSLEIKSDQDVGPAEFPKPGEILPPITPAEWQEYLGKTGLQFIDYFSNLSGKEKEAIVIAVAAIGLGLIVTLLANAPRDSTSFEPWGARGKRGKPKRK